MIWNIHNQSYCMLMSICELAINGLFQTKTMDVELEEKTPPPVLYHGTGEKYVDSIEAQGLIPKTRLYVHLSGDYETAFKVGARHGKPRIYQVHAGKMAANGYVFYRSVNGVWLTKSVPPKYLTRTW